jgi:1-acyl-sn-glycerol-3-phosphate acyltransferase
LLWLIGVGIRYGLLLPFRLLSMFVTMSVFLAYLAWTLCIGGDYQRAFCFGCQAFLWSLGAIVRHHGRKLRHRVPHLYVANHTSYLDFAILSSHEFPLAPLGQIHGGLFGFVQRTLLQTGLGALVFNRDEERDRAIVAQRMREHTQDLRRAPLLVFPEGTCVNNEATVLFHKGAFDLEADVVPVAIKYNKRLFDPYWNTREQAFSQNILYLMTRWLFMVDVWWLPRQCRLPDESAIDFSNRVKALISEAAGLANLGWDGYMKNFMRPAFRDKLLASMQRQYADALLRHALLLQSSLTSKRPKDDGLVRAEREEPTIVKSWWRKRSLSAVMCDELERRSASPLLPPNAATLMATTTVEPWVDIKTSLSNRRWMPKRTTAPQPPSTQSPFPSTLPSNPAPSSQLDASKVSESRDDD